VSFETVRVAQIWPLPSPHVVAGSGLLYPKLTHEFNDYTLASR
jgi:hypothetical protein